MDIRKNLIIPVGGAIVSALFIGSFVFVAEMNDRLISVEQKDVYLIANVLSGIEILNSQQKELRDRIEELEDKIE